MADSLARLVVTLEAQTLQYQQGLERANQQLEQFGSRQKSLLSTVEGSFKSFSRGIHELFAGAGIFIGFRTLYRELEQVSEKYKDVDAAAKSFVQIQQGIAGTIERVWLRVLDANKSTLGTIAKYFEENAAISREYEGAQDRLTRATNTYNDAIARGVTLQSAYGKALKNNVDVAQAEVDRLTGGGYRGEAGAAAAKAGPINFAIADTGIAIQKARYEKQKAFDDNIAKQNDITRKMEQDLDSKALDERQKAEQAFADQMSEIERKRVQERVDEEMRTINQIDEAQKKSAEIADAAYKGIMESDAEVNKRRIDEMQKRSQAFGDLFAANLIEAADGGFKAVLKSWTLTLEQMVLKTAATNLFESMFKQGFTSSAGGWVGKIAGVLGLAGGGPVMAGTPYLVGERGPELFVSGSAGSIVPNGAGGVVINQHIDARNATDPAQIAFAMKVAKNQALVEMRDMRRRGR